MPGKATGNQSKTKNPSWRRRRGRRMRRRWRRKRRKRRTRRWRRRRRGVEIK